MLSCAEDTVALSVLTHLHIFRRGVSHMLTMMCNPLDSNFGATPVRAFQTIDTSHARYIVTTYAVVRVEPIQSTVHPIPTSYRRFGVFGLVYLQSTYARCHCAFTPLAPASPHCFVGL